MQILEAIEIPEGEDVLVNINAFTGFKVAQLPVRYLGVPLVSRKLNAKDFSPLIESIRRRLSQWANRKLSYGGRLQLIKAVVFSVTNYWCRQLVLPKSVIQRIEQLCARFFWKGYDTSTKGARISWKQIWLSKSEGGLGIQGLADWNKACLLHLVKKIMASEGSPWIAWIREYVIGPNGFSSVVIRPYHCFLVSFACFETLFSVWDGVLDQLPTADRLCRFGIMVDLVCKLCRVENESRNHLFLACPFFMGIWMMILKNYGINRAITGWVSLSIHCVKVSLECVHILHLGGEKSSYFLFD
ncbi:hypothetical protein GQ457_03G021770 [Hibiscus cannabinus]